MLACEVNSIKIVVLDEQFIAVAKCSQHCPNCFCACFLYEEGMQEEKALQRQPMLTQALRTSSESGLSSTVVIGLTKTHLDSALQMQCEHADQLIWLKR